MAWAVLRGTDRRVRYKQMGPWFWIAAQCPSLCASAPFSCARLLSDCDTIEAARHDVCTVYWSWSEVRRPVKQPECPYWNLAVAKPGTSWGRVHKCNIRIHFKATLLGWRFFFFFHPLSVISKRGRGRIPKVPLSPLSHALWLFFCMETECNSTFCFTDKSFFLKKRLLKTVSLFLIPLPPLTVTPLLLDVELL